MASSATSPQASELARVAFCFTSKHAQPSGDERSAHSFFVCFISTTEHLALYLALQSLQQGYTEELPEHRRDMKSPLPSFNPWDETFQIMADIVPLCRATFCWFAVILLNHELTMATTMLETSFTELLIHASSVLWARMSSINRSRWINDASMNRKCGLVRSRVLRGLVEGGLPAQVNEVVWECGLGPDCSMCGARFSLGGICTPKTTGETILASGFVCTCWYVCVRMYCMCAYARDSVCDIALRMTLVEALLSLCLMLAFVHLPLYTCLCLHACLFPLVCGVFVLWSVCFPMSVFGLTTNVYTDPPPPNLITIPSFPPPFYSTPSRPRLLVFAL